LVCVLLRKADINSTEESNENWNKYFELERIFVVDGIGSFHKDLLLSAVTLLYNRIIIKKSKADHIQYREEG
jgi:hypothetical protein